MADDILEEDFDGHADAPTRHVLPWRDEAWYDKQALDEETRRIFDICHGCRRCFNLCDSFPKLFDLRSDPFEHAEEIDAMGYQRWRAERMFVLVPAQAYVAQFLETFKEFPPRQTPASFTIDQVMEKLKPRTN